jgi:hypothetical protein
MLAIYRTHSQTYGLFTQRVDEDGHKYDYLLDVAHRFDSKKLKAWRKRGAK